MAPHVAILVHQYDSFEKTGYLLKEISEIWRDSGLRVSIVRGIGHRVEADLVILHVDLTVVPDDYLEFLRQYPAVLNGRVANISKSLTSSHLVRRNDGYEGRVIVKTNRNTRGVPEARLAARRLLPRRGAKMLHNYKSFLQEAAHVAGELLSSNRAGLFRDYSIFESARQVPPEVWDDPVLIVEKFLSERRDGLYCLRTWTFFGDREVNALSYSHQPIVKSSNVVRREAVPEVPEALRLRRQDLGFDFGRFDYAIVDGRTILYDTNRTPAIGPLKEKFFPSLRGLAGGIKAYL